MSSPVATTSAHLDELAHYQQEYLLSQWRPHPGQQTAFLSSPAFEALFGGAAGPGKTECLVMEPLRQVANPFYNAILFRRTFTRLDAADGMIRRSEIWYPALGGDYNKGKHIWTFPSGAQIYFGHMEYEKDRLQYQGSQFGFIGFDELTEFSKVQYTYMFTRCRAPKQARIRTYVRGATNPGNEGHEWVKSRFVTKGIINKLAWFVEIDGEDTRVPPGTVGAKSRAYYPALLESNPSLDDEYRYNIMMTADPVERARLLSGDWDIINASGVIYSNWSVLNITDEADYVPGYPVYWTCDDGYAHGQGIGSDSHHPRVILLVQISPVGEIRVFAEYYKTLVANYEDTIDEVLGNIEKLIPGYGYPSPEAAYVDASAAMFQGALNRRGIYTISSRHDVVQGIKNVRRLICDVNGVRLIKVHPRCVHTIREMPIYLAKETVSRDGEPVPVKKNDHCPDALRYMAWDCRYIA